MSDKPGGVEYNDAYWEAVVNGSVGATPEAWAMLGFPPLDGGSTPTERGVVQEEALQQ